MSTLAQSAGARERLIHFEIGGVDYALPIADVLEVVEVSPAACVPTLARRCVGVVNHHGDALPVIERAALFALEESALPPPQHLLVIADAAGEVAHLALPVDRILGLLELPRSAASGNDLVRERHRVANGVVHVLATRNLLVRAAEVIDGIGGRSRPSEGGLS